MSTRVEREAPQRSGVVALAEWNLSAPLELTVVERRALETHFEAVVTADTINTFRVRPGSVIGAIDIAGRHFVVTPKIPVDRVLFMTAYAADPHTWQDRWSSIKGTGTLTDGIASLFVSACQRTLGQGLLRSYRTVNARSTAVKGRVRWPQQIRQIAPLPIAVRYQVHDDDVMENQLVRAAASALRHQRITDAHTRSGLARLWQQLRHLTPITGTPQLVDRITWTRHNIHYRPLLQLVRTILAGTMLDVGAGLTPVPGFTLRLYDVFEQFVRVALREAFNATERELPDNPRLHRLFLDTDRRVGLQPDIGLKIAGTWRFVGDVKYKRDTSLGHSGDLYQLLAYATASQLQDATLIYADGPSAPGQHRVRESDISLHVHHLRLSKPPLEVLRDVARLAADSRRSDRLRAASG